MCTSSDQVRQHQVGEEAGSTRVYRGFEMEALRGRGSCDLRRRLCPSPVALDACRVVRR